jgi:hypothetical protein
VPEQEHRVTSEKAISDMMAAKQPQYLFVDEKITDLNDEVVQVLKGLGYALDEVPQARSSSRYRLYRLGRRDGRPQEEM